MSDPMLNTALCLALGLVLRRVLDRKRARGAS